MKKSIIWVVSALAVFSGCDSYTGSGAYMGASLGSILGSAIGGITGGPQGSDLGTIVGMAGGINVVLMILINIVVNVWIVMGHVRVLSVCLGPMVMVDVVLKVCHRRCMVII